MPKSKAVSFAREGEIYRLKKDYDKALPKFKQAIELDEKYAWARAHYGATLRDSVSLTFPPDRQGKPSVQYKKCREGEEALKEAIRLRRGTYIWAKANLGYLYFKWGKVKLHYRAKADSIVELFNRAYYCFEEATAEDDNYAWAFAHFGQVLIQQAQDYEFKGDKNRAVEKYNQAREKLDTAVSLVESYSYAYSLRAIAYGGIGKYETDLKKCKEAYKDSLDNITTALHYNPKVYGSPQGRFEVQKRYKSLVQKEVQT
ncbi:MAG: tetratricopeptide repeat protein [Cyanobacteria bacterium P01_E01_bin.42]